MDHHVEVYVKNCVTCSEMDKTAKTHFAPLTPVPLPSAAWEKLAVDLVGPFYSAPYGQRFAITPVENSLGLSLKIRNCYRNRRRVVVTC
ncbi:hypothetical protein T4D_3775, partial [Trichinella pseudospiralis]